MTILSAYFGFYSKFMYFCIERFLIYILSGVELASLKEEDKNW